MKILILIATLIGSTPLFASGDDHEQQHQHGSHVECPLPKKLSDIIECALDFHPKNKKDQLFLDSQALLLEKAAQSPNPILTTRYVKKSGEEISELESNILFTLELGGKKTSRMEVAKAFELAAHADIAVTRSKLKVLTILNLFRLRQLQNEKKYYDQTLKAFKKVIGQLHSLPRLSSKQEASLILFEVAQSEIKADLSELFDEERRVEHFFHIATGHSLSEIEGFLPPDIDQWPTHLKVKGKSPHLQKYESQIQIAQKSLDLENSRAWPNLQIGPSLAIEKDGLQENRMVGINLRLPLPLFNTNSGGRALAKAQAKRAKKEYQIEKEQEKHERHEQLLIYKNNVSLLKVSLPQKKMALKHKRIEKLYLRGVVNATTFLESTKQQLNYLKKRNQRELTALNALWMIRTLDGTVMEETL